MISIVQVQAATPPYEEVHVRMSRAEAVALFHDLNRVMAILDDARANEDDGMVGDMDGADQAAYDHANDFLALIQRELQIDPEDPRD